MDVREILSNCELFNSSMFKENTVSFGATVELINEDNGKKISYTIVSIYESDVSNGYISVECPLVKSMLGYSVGDEFEFNDVEYIINNISYDISKY